MTEIRFEVGMTCGGCSSAVERILNKVDGVTNVETNVAEKSVVVEVDDEVKPEDLLEKLNKWSEASGIRQIGVSPDEMRNQVFLFQFLEGLLTILRYFAL